MDDKTILDTYCQQMSSKKGTVRLSPEDTRLLFSEFEAITIEIGALESAGVEISPRLPCYIRRMELIDTITTSCLPYVLSLAKNYVRGYTNLEILLELLAEGNLGLCIAVSRYNWRYSVPFHNYASHWIKANYHTILRNFGKVVKNSNDNAEVYLDSGDYSADEELSRLAYFSGGPSSPMYDDDDEGEFCERLSVATAPDLDESLTTYQSFEDPRVALEYYLRTATPLDQIVLRMSEGLVFEKSIKLTQLRKFLGAGFTNHAVKVFHSRARDCIVSAASLETGGSDSLTT